MSHTIEKTCKKQDNFRRSHITYRSARQAFGAVLDFLKVGNGSKLLVPGYIGFSAYEGSGVYDPIRERGIEPVFYHMGDNLRIVVDDLKEKIDNSGAKVLLLLHYFGFADANAKEVIEYAHSKGLVVIEDAAHGLYTDKINMACGRDAEYTLYSLHKMLPFAEGGVLVGNGDVEMPAAIEPELNYHWEEYDLTAIARKREENYNVIREELKKHNSPYVASLYGTLPDGIVPQTYPVVLNGVDRDKVYSVMNEKGWGVVSLYHTMIQLLQNDEFAKECWLSKHITNLPLHQDVDKEMIPEMVKDFIEVVNECKL